MNYTQVTPAGFNIFLKILIALVLLKGDLTFGNIHITLGTLSFMKETIMIKPDISKSLTKKEQQLKENAQSQNWTKLFI